jgi:hypothetical protein
MRGRYTDYVKVTDVDFVDTPSAITYTITTDGRVNDVYLKNTQLSESIPDTKFTYIIDVNGWYSYKIVVKQTEQEYYNVYLPSAIGATGFTTSTDTSTSVSYITLINDNINKVPRDLAEVGPDQKQYRSSIKLFGRVQPTFISATFGNKQYFPTRTADTSTAIGNVDDLIDTPTPNTAVFQYGSDPILARITTNKQFGIDAADFTGDDRFQLAVYETQPVISNLDIYWETSHTGLISDLNSEALTGFEGPVNLDGWNDILNENSALNSSVTQGFVPVDSDGVEITGYTISLESVVDGNSNSASNKFSLQYNSGNSEYYIRLDEELVFVEESPTVDVFTFTFTITDNNPSSVWGSVQLSKTLELTNTDPTFDAQIANEYYYFYEDSDVNFVIHNFRTFANNNAQNGSANASLRQNQLTFELGGQDANLFTLNATTGELKPSSAGVAAGYNKYTITVTLRDANGNGTNDVGGEVTNTYYIIKGFTPINLIPSETILGEEAPIESGYEKIAWIFYIAENELTESDLPSPSFTVDETYLHRLGESAFTDGTFQFGVENIHIKDGPSSLYGGQLKVDIYYRSNSSGAWSNSLNTQPPKDLNNSNSQYDNISNGPGLLRVINDSPDEPFAKQNLFYAQDTAGEYAFVVTFEDTELNLPSGGYTFSASVYLRDLHYLSSARTQEKYKYTVYTNSGTGWTTTPTARTGPAETVYSDQPLGEYNTKFWEDSDLATVWEPPTSDKYYLFELIGSDPVDPDIRGDYKYVLSIHDTISEEKLISYIKINADGNVDRTSTNENVLLRQYSYLSNLEDQLPRYTRSGSGATIYKYYSW